MDTSAQVLGASYFGPVEGSPLIPPEIITLYFVVFLIVLTGVYVIVHRRRKPVLLWHKIKLFVVLALSLKVFFFVGAFLLAFYWLFPSPAIQKTNPVSEASNNSTNRKIEIIFDKPVSRSLLEKSITPETPGVWVFEDSLYATHFYRKVTFYPTQSLNPDTNYTIKLSNIQNVLKVSKPYEYTFSFKTQKPPVVASVSPLSGATDVAITTPITVALSDENDSVSSFDFKIEPDHPLTAKLNSDRRGYTLTPDVPFAQGTNYKLTILKSDIILNIPTNTIIRRSDTTSVYQGTFTTRQAPGLVQFSPNGDNISINSPIKISFSSPMDRNSVEDNFSISPPVAGSFSWNGDQNLTFSPQRLAHDTSYTVKLAAGTKALDGGFFDKDTSKTFTTIGRVKVSQFTPADGWSAVAIDNKIKTTFNQDVDHASAESKFSLTPEVTGVFSWDGNTMIFTPSKNLPFSTKYKVTIASGVKTVSGLDSNTTFEASFTTQEGTTKLAVPVYLQQSTLSCEIAALRMALAYKGVQLSEATILSQVGVDNTPHSGNTWGNPNVAFVGNVNGTQMVDGYGVHWAPIARVARMHRTASEFTGWDIAKLTDALSKDNPVVIWVYAGGGYPTSWTTPDGQTIAAYRDEHAVTAVGFVGPAENPSQIVINDPLHGQVYWQRAYFDRKWNSFGRSGVVVF